MNVGEFILLDYDGKSASMLPAPKQERVARIDMLIGAGFILVISPQIDFIEAVNDYVERQVIGKSILCLRNHYRGLAGLDFLSRSHNPKMFLIPL